jgi:hypothetical protein
MNSLRELQRLCERAFLRDDSGPLLAYLGSDRIPASARIEVYQNNARETFRKTLARAYPVIERLVGVACFRGLAAMYMREHPSRSGDLQNFGAAFADFLDGQYGSTEFRYLGDVARLEWAIEEALLEPLCAPLSLVALGTIDPEHYATLIFETVPSLRLVGSDYPVLSIWRANQNEAAEEVDLAQGGEQLALRRTDGDVEMRRLEPATFALACCLARGMTLADSCSSLPPDADLQTALGALITGGYLKRFSFATAI